jgi:hypothetical protein
VNATRTIAGRPLRSGAAVAQAIVDLIATTLDASPHIAATGVRDELESVIPALGLLASGGHLMNGEVVLVAADLRLTINVPVGEKALNATENDSHPRGAATATDWTLHLPAPNGMAEFAAAACPHLSTDTPVAVSATRAVAGAAAVIDLTRLARKDG